MVLLSMGGIRWDYVLPGELENQDRAWVVVPGGSRRVERRGRLILLPFHAGIYHPDLVCAADLVVGKLGYSAPEALRAALDAHPRGAADLGGAKPFRRSLDMGCGTGLVARQVRNMAEAIDGLDIAPRMAAAARGSGLYDQVFEEDVAAFLTSGSGRERSYDLALSADVFIYIGDLEAIFAALGERMPSGGLFCFSVERLEEGDFKLLATGRYAQSRAYIERLAAAHGFEVRSRTDFTLRHEWSRPIAGLAFLLQRA